MPSIDETPDDLGTLSDLAEEFHVTPKTLQYAIRTDRIVAYRRFAGRGTFLSRAEVADLLRPRPDNNVYKG